MGEKGNKRIKRLCIRLSERDAYMLDYVSTRMKRPKSEIVRRALRNVCVAENYGYTDGTVGSIYSLATGSTTTVNIDS